MSPPPSQDLPVGFVIPWFGADLKGGAETAAWQIANRLADRGRSVEVLTTCCRSFLDDWAVNHLPPGIEHPRPGLIIRRFPVIGRDAARFAAANDALLAADFSKRPRGALLDPDGPAEDFFQHGSRSPAMMAFLKAEAPRFAAIIFTPYLYSPILEGVHLAAGRAIFRPCLHDECYAWMPRTAAAFHAVRSIIFNSAGEARLAERMFGPAAFAKGEVVGEGIETNELSEESARPGRIEALAGRPFLLYLGRRDALKGADQAVAAFAGFVKKFPGHPLQLVLAGPGHDSYGGKVPGCIDLGLVPAAQKAWLLRNCRALIHPSRNESYSRAVMEAWFCNRPVAVERACLATSMAVEASAGGLIASGLEGWTAAISDLAHAPAERLDNWGQKGRAYAEVYGAWDQCIDRYLAMIDRCAEQTAPAARPVAISTAARPRAVHQLVTGYDVYDAISDEARTIRSWLRRQGFASEIIALYLNELLADDGLQFPVPLAPGDGVIYHHSIGSQVVEAAIAHTGPKALIYHNITPPELIAPWNPRLAGELRSGLAALPAILKAFPEVIGVSDFNASELRQAAPKASVHSLYMPVPPEKWDVVPDAGLVSALRSTGACNLMFVGRWAANKCVHELIEVLHHLVRMGVEARLLAPGGQVPGDPYAIHCHRRAHELGVYDRLYMPGKLPVERLAACWLAADAYVSLSRHEGFGVPLAEAMHWRVPIIARSGTAVDETVADAGVVFSSDDPAEIAALVKAVLGDQELRERCTAAGVHRRHAFLPAATEAAMANVLLPIFS
ncbi:hypothetical protein LBMAG53_11580 [Planctomycetota bacterium]|nr:hypothetical protein LBMAG53_11580 [Planctomycetota bacterium]